MFPTITAQLNYCMHVLVHKHGILSKAIVLLSADIEAAAFPAKHICRRFQAAVAAGRAGEVQEGRSHVAAPHRCPSPSSTPCFPLQPLTLWISHCQYSSLCPSPLPHPYTHPRPLTSPYPLFCPWPLTLPHHLLHPSPVRICFGLFMP